MKDFKIEYIGGKPVVSREVVRMETSELPGWLGDATDVFTLMLGLAEANIPFKIQAPGTPVRGKPLDRWRVHVYAKETETLESFTAEGVAKVAHARLAFVEMPEVTLTDAIQEDYRKSEVESISGMVKDLKQDEEEALAEIALMEQSVEDELLTDYDTSIHGAKLDF